MYHDSFGSGLLLGILSELLEIFLIQEFKVHQNIIDIWPLKELETFQHHRFQGILEGLCFTETPGLQRENR